MEIYNNKIMFPCRANKRPAVETWKTDVSQAVGNHPFVGMRTGQGSYTVVDVDVLKEKHEDTYENGFDVTELHDIQTFTIQTPSGGKHLYFNYDSDVYTSTFVNGYTVDIRNDDGYAIVPPSKGYEIVNLAPVIDMPACVKSWIQKDENQQQMKRKKQKKPQPVELLQDPLSKLLKTRVTTETTAEGITITSPDGTCFVEDGYKHTSANHSSIFYNKSNKTLVANCFSHKAKKITGKLYQSIMDALKPKDEETKEIEHHDFFDIEYLIDLPNYETKKKYFEQYVLMIETPKQMYLRIEKNNQLVVYTRIELSNAFTEDREFVDRWIIDPKKRKYHEMDFVPNCKDPRIFNTFTGFDVTNVEVSYDQSKIDQLVKPFINHIDILTNYHKPSTEHFLNWIAQIFQQPEENTRTAVVIRGEPGCGKGALGDTLKEMIGERYYFCSSNPDDFFDKHAEALWNKILVIPDEARGKDTFEQSDKMKGWISATKIRVNPKNLKPLDVHNCARFIFLSNNMTPLKVEPNERRYIIFEASDNFANNKKYFDQYYCYLKDKQRLRAFYDFLMSRDISKVDWVNDRPITEAYTDMVQIKSHLQFLAESLTELFKDDATKTTLSATAFLSSYVQWREVNRYKEDNMNSTLFGRLMTKVPGITKTHKTNGTVYELDKNLIHPFLIKEKLLQEEPKAPNIFAALDKKQKQKENGDLTLKLSI